MLDLSVGFPRLVDPRDKRLRRSEITLRASVQRFGYDRTGSGASEGEGRTDKLRTNVCPPVRGAASRFCCIPERWPRRGSCARLQNRDYP